MLKMVLDDYKYNYKLALKRFFNSGVTGIHIGWCTYIPIFMKEEIIWVYFFIFITLIIAEILSVGYSGILNKTLFLCPLSKEQRESYFKTALRIRISIPMIFIVVGAGILGLTKQSTLLENLILVIVMILYIVSINICWLIDGDKIPNQTKKMNTNNYNIWNAIVHIIGVVNAIGIYTEIVSQKSINRMDGIIYGCLVTLQLVAFIVVWRRYYQPIKSMCTDYNALSRNFSWEKDGAKIVIKIDEKRNEC